MSRSWGGKTILFGIAGAIAGLGIEAAVNRVAGRTVILDGLMWGAVLAVLIASLPNFLRMGYLTVRSENKALNFAVGVGMFILISVVGIVVFFSIAWVITRFLP